MRVAALGLVMVLAGVADAQPAAKLFEEGLALIDRGKPAEACAKLQAALSYEPGAPGVLLNLGRCNLAQGKRATALRWFREAQVRAAERNMTETETAAKAQTSALATSVPTIRLAFTPALPDGATVLLDGATLQATDFARLEIDPGTHVVEVSTRPPTKHTMEIREDDRQRTISIRLAEPPAPVFEWVDRGAGRRRTGVVLGGIGLGLLAAETALAVYGKRAFERAADRDEQQRWKTIVRWGSTPMFAVGAVAVATGVVLYVRAPGTQRVERTAVVPVVGDGSIGVVLGGGF